MSWVRLDDGFHRNTKQLSMSDGAFRLYVCALSFCAQEREATGYLSEQQAQTLRRSLRKGERVITELLELNAWEQADGGYLIHDYEEYVEKGSKERTRQWRERKRLGDVTVTSLARDGYPVPVPVLPPQPPVNGDVTYSRPQAASGDVTSGGDSDYVADEGSRHDGLTPISRVGLGTLLEKARANREAAARIAEASEA